LQNEFLSKRSSFNNYWINIQIGFEQENARIAHGKTEDELANARDSQTLHIERTTASN